MSEDVVNGMLTERILLLYDNQALLQKVIAESGMWKISILECDPMAHLSFGSLEGSGGDTVYAVHYQAHTMLTLLNQARAKFPAAGIIILTSESVSGPTRGLLLLSGADACFDEGVSSVEVIATIQALRRRESAFLRKSFDAKKIDKAGVVTTEPVTEPWQLCNDGWSLQTPRGHSISMTGNERFIMQKLLENFPKVVSREALSTEREMSERYISLLISRMKRKAKLLGEDLPVRAIRGQGYVFLGMNQD